jgi:hypothetical protein
MATASGSILRQEFQPASRPEVVPQTSKVSCPAFRDIGFPQNKTNKVDAVDGDAWSPPVRVTQKIDVETMML